jgi:hypothetical protein
MSAGNGSRRGRYGDAWEEAGPLVEEVVGFAPVAAPVAAAPAPTFSSWAPVDLESVVNAGGKVEEPTILSRGDGSGIFYPGRLHGLIGEPEAGKGWIASAATAERIELGEAVLWIDFEDEATEQIERLVALGVDLKDVITHLIYVHPEDPLGPGSWVALKPALACRPGLVIVNGVTIGMTLNGFSPNDNADAARWQQITRQLGRGGAAVVELDHVVKDKEARGRYALGAQHKLAGVDVALVVARRQEFGRGRVGEADLLVKKDRPGFLRRGAAGEKIATVRLTSAEDGAVTVSLDAPEAVSEDGRYEFRPTTLMERLSAEIERSPGMGVREVRASVKGQNKALEAALALLVSEQYVEVRVEGQKKTHFNNRLYRAEDDPKVVGHA